MVRFISLLFIIAITTIQLNYCCADELRERDILQAMKKATDFMMNTVSNNGGFVWKYTEDLSDQWGETPARKTMIWVQDPGTVGVGEMLLDAYRETNDPEYLSYASRVANALIWGQHPSGGWHYFIDFDMSGVQSWYDEVFSKCWGWEEYYHYYGNCTFDDNVTTGATKFLSHLYMTTLEPQYRIPLVKALDFILESQYPNGAWPQRYPLMFDYPHDGHSDYTSYYTFNDNVIEGNIYFLLEAWEKLGNKSYRDAAIRGMDFVYVSQLPLPQAGWSDQFDLEMNPAAARSYEPKAISSQQTVNCVKDLMTFYMITGNRKYLRGIPDALTWLDNSKLSDSYKIRADVSHATFYEVGTNKPLNAHREGTSIETGRYWVDYNSKDTITHYGMQTYLDLSSLEKEYDRVSALSPEEAMAEYKLKHALPSDISSINPDTVKAIISTMDKRGAWVEEISLVDYKDLVHNPRKVFRGISTGTYIKNMETMVQYLKIRSR